MKAFYAALLLVLALAVRAQAQDWPVFGHDSARSSAVYGDGSITANNVARLRLHWRAKLGDVADTAPIFLSRVSIKGKPRAMLFETAKNGTTYGIDARTGKIVWRFATEGPNITTAVPAADPSGRWIYAGGVDGFVHKVDPATGEQSRTAGFPIRITTMPETEKNASALNVANGYVYAATSGYLGDAPPYVGHLVSVRLSDGATHVFNTLCSDVRSLPSASSCSQNRSGIWARGGVVVDPDPAMHGRVYVTTGNGEFNARAGNYGDSVLALSADGATLLGSYTPADYAELQAGDTDLGSSAPVLLPRESRSRTPLMLVQGGKDAILRLLDRAHLPGVGKELQRVDSGSQLYSAPAVWRDSSQRTWVYLGLQDGIRAYRLETDSQGTSRLVHAWSANAGESPEGTSPVVSNGLLFVATNGAIHVYDARSGRELWNSARTGAAIGDVHWQSPIVADGWLYCSDEDGYLNAYGFP